jgi:signal transduction histidine kinase
MLGHSTRQTELARRDNQELVEILQTVQKQLQELAVVEERNRLAREIHDGLGHYLTATTMQIQGAKALLETTGAAAQAPAVLGALGKTETLLQEALADVRRSVQSLRAAPAESRSLPGAIGDLVAECQAAAGLAATFDLLGTPHPLNPQVELTLYRAAQEGLTNVRKHAQATNVSVLLWYDAGKVGLRITDDGQAMGEALSHGYGLLGLRERVQIVGVESAPGQPGGADAGAGQSAIGARNRGAAPGRDWRDQSRDRGDPGHCRGNRQKSPDQYPRQARGQRPHPGRGQGQGARISVGLAGAQQPAR